MKIKDFLALEGKNPNQNYKKMQFDYSDYSTFTKIQSTKISLSDDYQSIPNLSTLDFLV